ncbi:MAG: hypothetical protein IPK60_19725 [Sandaracinaceae bacterium]|nr:hypothetical protein [Sandaracinaceae bacterium]
MLSIAGCGGNGPVTGPRPTTPGQVEAALTPEEIVGHWVGDWGEMSLRIVGDEIWGAYNHEAGTIRGKFRDGVFRGWWTQLPTRQTPNDAGRVELLFSHNDQGQLVVDGRWKSGSEEENWNEDWDLGWIASPVPEELITRFNDATIFVQDPELEVVGPQ